MGQRRFSVRQQLRKSPIRVWKPIPKQVLAAKLLSDAGASRVLFDGGARSGKTVSIVRHLFNRALQFPQSRQLACRLHLKDAMATTFDTLRRYAASYVPAHLYEVYLDPPFFLFHNGAQIAIDGLDDKDRVEKILGSEWFTIFVNEATQTSYATVNLLKTRLADYPRHYRNPEVRGPRQLILDCNPKSRRHWVHRWAIEGIEIQGGDPVTDIDKFSRLNWTPFDNLKNLPSDFIETLKTLPTVKRKRMLDGVWCENEGSVYDMFDEDTHTCPWFPIPRSWKVYRAVDFGFSNPFACLWITENPDGRAYVADCHYQSRLTVRAHADIIRARPWVQHEVAWTVADWDAEDCATLRENGIPTVEAIKEIRPGIDAVIERLKVRGDGRPGLLVMRTTANQALINEFYEYCWREGSDIRNASEKPIESNNHALDALRYWCMRRDRGTHTSQFAGIGHNNRREALLAEREEWGDRRNDSMYGF